MTTRDLLTRLGACHDAREWAHDYPEPQTAWDSCRRGEWMAWWLGRLAEQTEDGSPEHRRAVLVACLCARAAPSLPEQIARALDLIEAWAWGGEDRREEAQRTAASIYAATASASASVYAATAADAAAAAATAPLLSTTTTATYDASDAATYDASAAASDAASAAATTNAARLALADLIRAAVPTVPLPGGT